MDRRRITPAEAALLIAPTGRTATKCLQAGLLSLLAAGRIGFEKPDGPVRPAALALRGAGAGTPDPLPRHVAVLETTLVEAGRGNRLTAAEVRAMQLPPAAIECMESRPRPETPYERMQRLSHGVEFKRPHRAVMPRLLENHKLVVVEKASWLAPKTPRRETCCEP
jgi:hypothetical protein